MSDVFSGEFWKTGIFLDIRCEHTDYILTTANEHRVFDVVRHWLLLDLSQEQSTKENETMALSRKGQTLLSPLYILPESEVTWVQLQDSENDTCTFLLLDVYRPSKLSNLNVTLAGIARPCLHELDIILGGSTAQRRKNLHGVLLRSGAAILYPHLFTGMYDISMRHVDTWTKITYPLVEYLAKDFNFSTTIMFRQPNLSSMSNIFVMPFDMTVWVSCVIICIITILTLCMQVYITVQREIEKDLTTITWPDIFTFVLGAICQQGFHLTPTTISGRITVFFLSLTSLFLFTSYSANIVALLQSPSNAIKTIADLIDSPIALGLQDIAYNHVYLKETSDKEIRHFYKRRVAPLGERAYLNVSQGMNKVRQGMFAFQVDNVAGYKEISETYTEREKCGLKEMELIPLPTLAVATSKHSGYREMFAQRVRWQREVGILDRMRRLWLSQKPICENMVTGFVSVGTTDFYPALKVLHYGVIASLIILVTELMYFYRSCFMNFRILSAFENLKKKKNGKIATPNHVTHSWFD